MTGPQPQSTGSPRARQDAKTYQAGWRMVGVGGEFVSHVLAGLLLGWGVDWAFGVRPWGLVGGAIAGLLVGTAQFIRGTIRINAGLGPVRRPPGGWKEVDDPPPTEEASEQPESEPRRDR